VSGAGALRIAIGLLALAGAGVAAYLTWVHYQPQGLLCFGGSSCEKVQRSSYAELGPLPVAVLGLAGYVAIGATALVRPPAAALLGALLALGGLAFSLWLVYVQGWILDAWCSWCLTSDVILALLALATVARAFVQAEPAPAR